MTVTYANGFSVTRDDDSDTVTLAKTKYGEGQAPDGEANPVTGMCTIPVTVFATVLHQLGITPADATVVVEPDTTPHGEGV